MAAGPSNSDTPPKSFQETVQGIVKEIVQPFVDLINAPRALWGINLAYVLEGLVYFGMLGYLAMHFSDFIFQGVDHADEWSHGMVTVLTAGITLSMVALGWVGDKWGIRRALLLAFILLLGGRVLMSTAPSVMGLQPARPGVVAGDLVDLHVTKLEADAEGRVHIAAATVIANDAGEHDVRGMMAIDLAAGEGTAVSPELNGKLVNLGRVTLLEGEKQRWKIRYGAGGLESTLVARAGKALELCEGATLTVENAYIDYYDEKFVVRNHWLADLSGIDTSTCVEEEPEEEASNSDESEEERKKRLAREERKRAKEEKKAARQKEENEKRLAKEEEDLTADERWEIPGKPPIQSAEETTLATLLGTEEGKVDLLLRDVYVTYVRNGGYYLQQERNGNGVFAFVKPLWTPLHIVTMLGILLVVIGYGMYQPSAYAAVRQFTTPATAAMGFAMLYALMNLGGWLPTFAFLIRDENFLGFGIPGTYLVYTAITAVALTVTFLILSRKTVAQAIARAKEETAKIKAEEDAKKTDEEKAKEKAEAEKKAAADAQPKSVPIHMYCVILACVAAAYWRLSPLEEGLAWSAWRPSMTSHIVAGTIVLAAIIVMAIPASRQWLARHPLADGKFFFFIFALIPVQTLFVYNWMVLPQYISRAYDGWIGQYFEIAANSNPILIFIAVPIIAALTRKAPVYRMMIMGTAIMAAPAFLLTIGPHWWTLFPYILIMTVGEAMWQPRFLQYAAEIAPEGRTGEYMGVAQLPWFLTKVLAPLLLTGWMMDRYCPAEGEINTQTMWLIYACIAMASPVLLILARGWIGKDFKTKA